MNNELLQKCQNLKKEIEKYQNTLKQLTRVRGMYTRNYHCSISLGGGDCKEYASTAIDAKDVPSFGAILALSINDIEEKLKGLTTEYESL